MTELYQAVRLETGPEVAGCPRYEARLVSIAVVPLTHLPLPMAVEVTAASRRVHSFFASGDSRLWQSLIVSRDTSVDTAQAIIRNHRSGSQPCTVAFQESERNRVCARRTPTLLLPRTKMAERYERVLLAKPEVFVYQIPPRATNRAVR